MLQLQFIKCLVPVSTKLYKVVLTHELKKHGLTVGRQVSVSIESAK